MPEEDGGGLVIPLLDGLAVVRVVIDPQEAVELLGNQASRLLDPSPLWERVGAVMREAFHRNFQSAGRPAWQALKPATVRKKAAAGLPARSPSGMAPPRLMQRGEFGPGNILIETGALRDSWVQQGAPGHVEEVSAGGDEFFIGSDYQVARQVRPGADVDRPYLSVRKSQRARIRRGLGGQVMVNLAAIHERGAPGANIPARPNTVVQDEELLLIEAAAARWVSGDEDAGQ